MLHLSCYIWVRHIERNVFASQKIKWIQSISLFVQRQWLKHIWWGTLISFNDHDYLMLMKLLILISQDTTSFSNMNLQALYNWNQVLWCLFKTVILFCKKAYQIYHSRYKWWLGHWKYPKGAIIPHINIGQKFNRSKSPGPLCILLIVTFSGNFNLNTKLGQLYLTPSIWEDFLHYFHRK